MKINRWIMVIVFLMLILMVEVYVIMKTAKENELNLRQAIDKVAPDWDANIILAHAALETGWYVHVPGNNFWGIKAGKSWKGKINKLRTHEWDDNDKMMFGIIDGFRAYPDAEEAVKDYVKLIQDKWPLAYINRKNAPNFTIAITDTRKWATDPNYRTKFMKVWKKIKDKEKETASVAEQKGGDKMNALISKFVERWASKKLGAFGIVIGALMQPEVQAEVKIVIAKFGALYVVMQGIIDAVKPLVEKLKERTKR